MQRRGGVVAVAGIHASFLSCQASSPLDSALLASHQLPATDKQSCSNECTHFSVAIHCYSEFQVSWNIQLGKQNFNLYLGKPYQGLYSSNFPFHFATLFQVNCM